MSSKMEECSSCDLCAVDLSSIQEQLEHDFSLIHHMKLHQKHKKLTHMCSLCSCQVGTIKSYVSHLHGSKHQKSLKSRKEQWLKSPPTLDDLGRRYHVVKLAAKQQQNKSRNSSNSKSSKDSYWDNNSLAPRSSGKNSDSIFENGSRKNQYKEVNAYNFTNFSARNPTSFSNHSPFRFNQFWYNNNNPNRMQNNQNWRHNNQGNFHQGNNTFGNFRVTWAQPPFAQTYNNWNSVQHNTWDQENFRWNSTYNIPECSSTMSNHLGNNGAVSEPDTVTIPESAEENPCSSAPVLDKQPVMIKGPKEAGNKGQSKKKRVTDKINPKLKKASNKRMLSPMLQAECHQDPDVKDEEPFLEDERQVRLTAPDKQLNSTKKNVAEIEQSNSDSQLQNKVNVTSRVKTESPKNKSNKSKEKRKSDRRHMYFLSSDSDSEDQGSRDYSDSSESPVDGAAKEKREKDESYNKALLNRLINFPCTRKQQVQLAKWMQEHSKLKKKLLFPRFNLQLVPPDSDQTKELELRRVLSEMMTELPGEAIDALVNVLKDDSGALPQEDTSEAAQVSENELYASDLLSQGQLPTECADFPLANSQEQKQPREQTSQRAPNLLNITIKPDPDGPESLSNDHVKANDVTQEKSNLPVGSFSISNRHVLENNGGRCSSSNSRVSASPDDSRQQFVNSPSSSSLNQHPFNAPVQPTTNVPSEVHAFDASPSLGPKRLFSEQASNSTHQENQRGNQVPTTSSGPPQSQSGSPDLPQTAIFSSDNPNSSNVDQCKPSFVLNMQENNLTSSTDHQRGGAFTGAKSNSESKTSDSSQSSSEPDFKIPPGYSEDASSHDPSNQQKWTEMPSWFKAPSSDFFENDSANVSAGPSNESSNAAHNLVDKLLALSREEEMIRDRSQKVEQILGQMYSVIEEWKQKKIDLHQEEMDLRKRRVNLLELLQGSLSIDPNIGSTSSTASEQKDEQKNSETSEASAKNENVTYLGTLDSTWDIIQQLGLNLPSTSGGPLLDPSASSKQNQKKASKGAPKKKSGQATEPGKTKGKRRSETSSSGKTKKQKVSDATDSAITKSQKKAKRKRNNAAEQAYVLQNLLDHITRRDPKASKTKSKAVHESAADSTSEDVPNSTTPARLSVIKNEASAVDAFGPLEAHESSILDIKVVNGFLYTCSSDKTAKCIEIKNPLNCVQYKGHEKTVTSVQLVSLDDGTERLFTSSYDGYLRCFDPQNGNLVKEHHLGSSILCMTKGFGNLYLGLNNGEVWPYRISSGKFDDAFEFSQMAISRIAAGREGGQRLLCVVTYDGSVSIRNAISGLLIRLLDIKPKPPCLLDIDGSEIFLTTADRSIFIFDLTSGSMLKRILCISVATGLYVTRNHMLICSFDGFIRCYNRKNWSLHKVYYGAGKAMAMCLEVNDGWIFSGNRQGIVEAFKTDHTVDATCWFQDCKTPFGHWKDLKHHLLADHMARVYSETVSQWHKCPWLDCQHLLKGITGQEKLQELEDHILEHAECTQR